MGGAKQVLDRKIRTKVTKEAKGKESYSTLL